jgi:O-acetyl-ADP-ribose deacetylase (regulator of RNase III)
MLLLSEDLFCIQHDRPIDLLIIPTNSTLKKDGSLVMGAGVAKQANQRYRGVAQKAGGAIVSKRKQWGEYNFFVVSVNMGRVGLLQTKINWKDPSPPELVKRSLQALAKHMRSNTETVAMPVVGAGLGGLERSSCLSMIEEALREFGDRVVVCDVER